MDAEEFDLSDWTVVDEDVSDSGNSPNKTHTKAKTQNRRRSSNATGLDKNAKSKPVNKPEIHSGTSTRNHPSKETSSKTDVASKDVAKSTTSSGVQGAGRNVTEPVVSISTSETSKNVVESKSDLPVVTEVSSSVTLSSTTSSGPLKKDTSEAVSSSLGPSTFMLNSTGNKKHTDEKVTCSQEIASNPESAPLSTQPMTIPVASTVSTNQLASQTSSSRTLTKSSTHSKDKSVDVESIAEIMAAVGKDDAHNIHGGGVEDVSDTELSGAMDIASHLGSKSQKLKTAGMKRDASPNKGGPAIKKAKVQDSKSAESKQVSGTSAARAQPVGLAVKKDQPAGLTVKKDQTVGPAVKKEQSVGPAVKKEQSLGPAVKKDQSVGPAVKKEQSAGPAVKKDQPAGLTVKKDPTQSDKNNGNQNQKGLKQQNQCNKTEENIKTSARNQVPGGMSSTPKGSSAAGKTAATTMKTPPGVSPVSTKTTTTSATAKTNDAENKPGTTSSTTVKRIIRRFHRMTQTISTEYSNKLVQCLIKIPSLDAPAKPNCHSEVQVSLEKAKDEVFYQKTLPDTARPEIFKVVSTFKLDDPGSRNIVTGPYGYGISFGHITAADMEKSMFRENLLAKSAYYSLSFNRQDFGVVDLFFGEEEHFVAVLTQIRKMKIGPRHLVVTYCKHLKESERAPESSVSSVKATIIYNQNFATTNFLAHTKAPLWNKPKVEEILTIHNMPEGIPIDFLKLIIPDALSVELDDRKQKFTQKGSRVHLGMDRKKGGDGFLKLFIQMYINNECLAFSVAGTAVSGDPDWTAILAEKKNRERNNQRELKAVARDISSTPYVGEEKEVEVIMQVETVPSVEKILSLPTWTGPSTVHKLQQPVCPPKSNKPSIVNNSAKNSAFSDVSDELSDISDTSNIGAENAVPKTGQKNATSPAQRKHTTIANRTSRVHHKISSTRQTEKRGSKHEPLTRVHRSTVKKTSVLTSKNIERRKEIRDRLQDKNQRNSLFKPLGRSIRGVRSGRPQTHDDRKERHDRVSRVSSSVRGKEHTTHRQVIPRNRVHDETETGRKRSQRDQPRVESARRGSFDKVSSHRDHGRNAEDRGRHSHSSSRTERTGRKSEEKDSKRLGVTSTVDRHGNKIVSFHKKREYDKKIHGSEESGSEKFSHGKMDRSDGNQERDSRRGSRLDLLVQRRLGSLERQEREADDSRQVILTRSRSPITRQVYRGRSTSPKKYQSMSVRLRQTSPSMVYGGQLRFSTLRRSRSPQQASHSSVLSPISAGEDEADDSPEGMWLPQPPATLVSQQDMRKSNLSTRSTNFVKPQAEWKSQISSDGESDKKAFVESQSARFIERFVQEVIGTGRASAKSAATSEKLPPKSFHDPAKVIEKIREIYNSGLNLNDKVNDSEDDEILNTAVSSRSQSRSGPAERVGQAASRSILKVPSNISSSLSHDTSLEPVGRFESRDERNSRGTGDTQRFDVPMNNRGKAVGREAGTISSQTNSRGYAELRVSDHPNSRGYTENRASYMPNSREYGESRVSDQPNSRGFGESRVSDQPNSREFGESRVSNQFNSRGFGVSRVSDQPNSRGFGESRVSDQPNSREFGESRVSNQFNSRGFGVSRVSDQPNSSRYREPGMANYTTCEGYQGPGMQDQPNYGQNREPELPNWPNSGRYSEFGIPNSGGFRQPETTYQQNTGGFRESEASYQHNTGGFRESEASYQQNPGGFRETEAPYQQNPGGFRETEAPYQQNTGAFRESGASYQQNTGGFRESEAPYQQNPGGFRETEAPNLPDSGVYHQNQPLQPPTPAPIVAPQGNSMQSAQEQLAGLENMAQMIAAGMEQEDGQAAPNTTPEVWNTASQQASTSGPQTHTASPQVYTAGPQLYSTGPQQYPTGPPFSFSGPQPLHGPSMNFSGPPPLPVQPNIHQPCVRGANPQPAPWPHSNSF